MSVVTNVTFYYLTHWSEENQRYAAYCTDDTVKFIESKMKGTIGGLLSFGKTLEESIKNLSETIQLALEGENTGIYGYTLTPKYLEIPNGQ